MSIVAGSYVAAREIYKAQVRKRRRRMQVLLDRIEERVAQASARSERTGARPLAGHEPAGSRALPRSGGID